MKARTQKKGATTENLGRPSWRPWCWEDGRTNTEQNCMSGAHDQCHVQEDPNDPRVICRVVAGTLTVTSHVFRHSKQCDKAARQNTRNHRAELKGLAVVVGAAQTIRGKLSSPCAQRLSLSCGWRSNGERQREATRIASAPDTALASSRDLANTSAQLAKMPVAETGRYRWR